MELFVRSVHDREVTASLTLVKAPPADGPPGLTYVVSRTGLVEAGTPYVIAALVDPAMAEDYRYPGSEVYGREQMRSHPSLADALEAWNGGDNDVFRRDREAHRRVEAAYRASVLRAAARHPSMQGRG